MIRILSHIIFAVYLLVASAGVAISAHYCHDNLVEVVIDKEAETCCDNAGCCSTETVLVQLDEEATSKAVVAQANIAFVQLFLISNFNIYNFQPTVPNTESLAFNAPPPKEVRSRLADFQTYLL